VAAANMRTACCHTQRNVGRHTLVSSLRCKSISTIVHRTSLPCTLQHGRVLSHKSSYFFPFYAIPGQCMVLHWQKYLSTAVLLFTSYPAVLQLLHGHCASHSHSVTGCVVVISFGLCFCLHRATQMCVLHERSVSSWWNCRK
jgi:hypothetical protein